MYGAETKFSFYQSIEIALQNYKINLSIYNTIYKGRTTVVLLNKLFLSKHTLSLPETSQLIFNLMSHYN